LSGVCCGQKETQATIARRLRSLTLRLTCESEPLEREDTFLISLCQGGFSR
jgi:hypothetical protein